MTRYKQDSSGLKQIANSPAMQAAVLAGATRGQRFAQSADPAGDYQVRAQPVAAGYQDEIRAGAILEDVAGDALIREGKSRTLSRAVSAIEAD